MTTELVLLLGLFAFLVIGAFLGDTGPRATFDRSGPRLGARIQQEITTGREFLKDNATNRWLTPSGQGPTGELQ